MRQPAGIIRHLAFTAALLMLVLTACSTTGRSNAQKAVMTPDQALRKATALLDDAMSEIEPKLQTRDDWPRTTELTAVADDHSLGGMCVTLDRYSMTKVARAKYGALLGVVERSWQKKGYRIGSVNPNQPAIFATAPDGSGIDLVFGGAGDIAFTATISPIPLIRDRDPFGTPGPQPTLSNGNPDFLPKIDDPFWSA